MPKLNYRNQKNAELIAAYWGKPLDKKDWFRMESTDGEEAEIFIYDIIGWPFIEASEFVHALTDITAKKITVRLNSPGGDVFDGAAVYNSLIAHPAEIVTRIEGLAASAASMITLAGNEVQAYKASWMMIHDPWAIVMGNQYDLRDVADILDQISVTMLDVYYDKSNIGKRELKAMMKDETWFTATQAKERRLVDTVLDSKPSSASAKMHFDLSGFANVPDDLSGAGMADGGGQQHEPTKREIEAALRDAGLPSNKAKALIAGGMRAIDEEEDLIATVEKTMSFIGGN